MTIKERKVRWDQSQEQETAQLFSVNGARYVALPLSKVRISQSPSSIGLVRDYKPYLGIQDAFENFFTVINVKPETRVTEEWLRKKLASYRSTDDVFCDEFLTWVLFTGIPAEESRISPGARHYMESMGITYKIIPAAASPGPYLACAGQLLEIYRLYDDTQGAFVTSILPSNDLQAQFEEPKPVCSRNLGQHYYPKSGGEIPQTGVVVVPSRLRDLPAKATAFAGLRVAVKIISRFSASRHHFAIVLFVNFTRQQMRRQGASNSYVNAVLSLSAPPS
ncbi:MAG: hypothetical protein Q9173_001652 [Seirophora scorigena]